MDTEEHAETLELIDFLSTNQTREWCQFAWKALAGAGFVPFDVVEPADENYLEQVMTLAVLATLADWFNDDYDLSDYEPSCDILNPKLQTSEFALGIYVERRGIEAYDDDGYLSRERAAFSAILERTREVAHELVKTLGISTVFASLWSIQQDPSISLPLTDEELDSVVNVDIDAEKGYRFERLQEV